MMQPSLPRFIAAAAVAVALLAAPAPAEACTCGDADYEASFAKSNLVFRGKVTAWQDRIATVAVEGYYKGHGPKQVALRGTGGGLCVRNFEVGATYVVFAEPDLNIGFCEATFRVSDGESAHGKTEEEVAALLVELDASNATAPGDGPALAAPTYVPTEEDRFLQDGWKDEVEPSDAKLGDPDPRALAADDAPPVPEPKAGPSCMIRVEPEGAPLLWLLLLLPLLLGRRRR